MTILPPRDEYLMGRLSCDQAVSASALRVALAIDAQCSPFQVQLEPLKVCGPSVLYRVFLPRSARATGVTDVWPLGRLSMISDSAERERLVSVTSALWPLLSHPETTADFTTVRMGDPVLYAFQLKPAHKAARVFSSPDIGSPPRPPRRCRPSFAWARDWLVTTLEEGGWRVTQTDVPKRYGDIDWAIGQ